MTSAVSTTCALEHCDAASTSRIASPVRPHCLEPDACRAAKPTTHCRTCWGKHLRAAQDANSEWRAAQAKGASRAIARDNRARWQDAEYRSKMTELARENAVLARPEVRERANSRAAIDKASVTRMPDPIPVEGLPLYRELTKARKATAAEARRIVRAEYAGTVEHAQRQIASIEAGQRLRVEREQAQAY